ncbi:MAG TPA: glycosyltransferase family 39 protein [Burkholderiales bacterium]
MRPGSLVLALGFFALVLFGTLGWRPVYKADEGRYAEIPREMAASGDWVTPRLNGLKYFEKPPLQYWATAAFFKAFGVSDAVSRLWTALAAAAGIALAFFAGRKLFGGEAGAFAALVLAGSPLYALLAQLNTLDMALSFFLSAAIFAFALERYYLFWAACAFAVLSKGLIGIVLPGATLFLYFLLTGRWALLGKMKILPGGLLFLVLSAPWFLAVSAANPEFARFFFIQEHFERFTTKMHDRYQPAWFFLPILAAGIAPWILPFFRSLARIDRRGPGFLLALWALVVFLFFSASGSKLPSYILPIFPALAVLIGAALAGSAPRRLLFAQAMLAVAAGVAIAALSATLSARMGDPLGQHRAWVFAIALWLAAAAAAAAVAAWRGKLLPAVAFLSVASFGGTSLALAWNSRLEPPASIRDQAAALGPVDPAARVFAVDFYDHTIPWYFRREVTMVGYKDELAQAIAWEPSKFIPDLPGFERAWAGAPAAYAVFSARQFPSLQKQLAAPMEIVSRGSRYVIVRKP